MQAQVDVTATYLTNADFETEVTGIASNNTIYDVSGWTETPAAGGKEFYKLGTINYETSASASLGFTSPSNGSSVTTEDNKALLGMKVHWEKDKTIGVSQTATLSAGVYTLTYDTYIQQNYDNATSICGFTIGGANYYDEFDIKLNTWKNHSQTFVITKDTEVKFSFGYKKLYNSGNGGGGVSPVLYVDNVKLTMAELASVGTSLINAGFESDAGVASGVTTYAKDMAANSTTYSRMQPVTGWLIASNGDARASATCAYNDGSWLGSKNYVVPTMGPDPSNSEDTKALGLISVWSGRLQYIQPVTLSAGVYNLSFNVYNGGGTADLASNLMGVSVGSNNYYATTKKYPVGSWTSESISFTLAEETTVVFSAGVTYGSGSATAPCLFIDGYTLTEVVANKTELLATIAKANIVVGCFANEALSEAISAAEEVNGDATADQTKVDNATTALNTAIATALTAIPNNTKVTALFVSSPSFEDGQGNWQWNSADDTGIKENINQYTTEGVDGARLFNTWGGTAEKYVEQTLTNLPTGYYTLTASFASDANLTATLYAGTESVTVIADATGNGKFVDYTTAPVKVEDGTLEIGIKSTNWYKVDNFRLTYYTVEGGGAVLDDAKLAAAKVSLQSETTVANVKLTEAEAAKGDAPFYQYSPVVVSALSDAINVAQLLVDSDEATLEQVNKQREKLSTVLAACVFTLPKETDFYHFILQGNSTSDKFAYVGKYMSLSGNGGTFKNEPSDAFGQSFAFKKERDDSHYYIFFINEVGEKEYFTTSKRADKDGKNNEQIRTTTDESKALSFRIEKMSNGIYLWNDDAGKRVGTNDGGLYTVADHNLFGFTVADKASVEVTVKAGKFAGRIFPFKPEALPAGIKAYTCAKVNGSELELTEVTELKANTPYLLENITDADYTATQTGFGTAVQMQYPEGELIGDYASEGNLDKGVYVLQTLDDKQAFYLVEDEDFPRAAYRVQVKAQENANVRSIGFPGTTDAINALLGGEVKAEAVYSVNGVRRNGLQKGVNIIRLSNGKTQKVIVK